MGGLVEAELLFKFGDQLGVEPLRAPIARGGVARPAAAALLAEVAAAAADARGRAAVEPLQLRDDALHRPARRELHDGEGDQHDAENRRDHQQQAAGDVGEHACGVS